jgi:hypothetical protein
MLVQFYSGFVCKNKRVNKHTKDKTINANSRKNMLKLNLLLDYYKLPWPFLSHCPLYIMPNSGICIFMKSYTAYSMKTKFIILISNGQSKLPVLLGLSHTYLCG